MKEIEELSVLIKAAERIFTVLKVHEKVPPFLCTKSVKTTLKNQCKGNNGSQNELVHVKQSLIALVNFYHALHCFSGGDTAFMNHWLNVNNKSFGEPPRNLLSTCEGIQRLSRYFDELSAIKSYSKI